MVAKIKASQIPASVLREIKGLPKRKSEKRTSWADIPPSYTKHKACGYAGTEACPYCEEGDGTMYVQLDEDYYGHPKTLHLIELLGPEADTYPPRLWTWAKKYAKGGIMRSESMIETACRWQGAPGRLVEALVTAGFVDREALTIHNWMKRTGHDLEMYEQKKQRLKEKRSGNIPGTFRHSDLSGAELNGAELSGADKGPGTVQGHLMRLAKAAKVAGRADTLHSYIESWVARSDAGKVEQILMDPFTRGKTVIEIQEHFFGKDSGNGKSWKDLIGGQP